MRTLGAVLGVWLAGAACALADPTQLASREALRGWEPVGRVDIGDRGYCTGTLIAPDLVLTAASCVIGEDGEPVDAGTIRFRAGLIEGVALADSAVTRTIVAKGYRHVEPASAEMILRDVALLELATPVPSGVVSAYSVALPQDTGDLAIAYYGGGKVEAPWLQDGCTNEGRQDGIFGVDCGAAGLALGAPIFERTGYRVKVVGIASAHIDQDGKTILLAMELPDIIAALKAALRRGEATSRAATAVPKSGAKRIKPGEGNDTGAKFVSP